MKRMKDFKNKLMMAVLSGAIIAGGSMSVFTDTAYAAENDSNDENSYRIEIDGTQIDITKLKDTHMTGFRVEMHHHRGSCDDVNCQTDNLLEFADALAKDYGVKRVDVVNAVNEGYRMHEVRHGCMVAKLSGCSLESVMKLRHDKSWQETESTLGVSPEDMYNAMADIRAEHLAERAHSDRETVAKLLKEKYHPRDIEIAGVLACESGKSIERVLNKKTANKNWFDVMRDLKIDYEDLIKNHIDHDHGLAVHAARYHHHFR